jgi:phage major head subunit gpT-like protein
MVISADLLSAMYATFNTAFKDGMQRGRTVPIAAKSMLEYLVKFSDIGMSIPSTTAAEIHLWISQIPGFREWVGDRVAKTLAVNGLKVENKDFEQTVDIPRNSVEDDSYGVFSSVIQNMGAEGADDAFWLDLLVASLISSEKWADDGTFFSATRKFGDQTINNIVDGSLTQANIKAAVNLMLGYKGDNGNTLGVVPYVVLCGKSAFWTAKKFCENEKITDDAGNEVDNETKGILAPRWHYGLNDDAWYVLGVKGSYKPLCAQRRKNPTDLQTLVNPADPNVFWQKKFVYGTDLRGNGFRPFPFLIVRGNAGNPPGSPAGSKGKKD